MQSNYNEMLTEVIYNKLAELVDTNQFQEALLLTTILRELRRGISSFTTYDLEQHFNSNVAVKPKLGNIKNYQMPSNYGNSALYKELKQQLQTQQELLQLQQPVEPSTYKWADGYVDPREDYWDK